MWCNGCWLLGIVKGVALDESQRRTALMEVIVCGKEEEGGRVLGPEDLNIKDLGAAVGTPGPPEGRRRLAPPGVARRRRITAGIRRKSGSWGQLRAPGSWRWLREAGGRLGESSHNGECNFDPLGVRVVYLSSTSSVDSKHAFNEACDAVALTAWLPKAQQGPA
jgi:hypothetical protein